MSIGNVTSSASIGALNVKNENMIYFTLVVQIIKNKIKLVFLNIVLLCDSHEFMYDIQACVMF